MSLASVYPYFTDCLCSIGLQEWETEIESESPPNTILEKSFRITLGDPLVDPPRHTTFPFTVPVEINLYFKTYNKPSKARIDALEQIDKVLCCLLDVKKRYGGPLKSVFLTGFRFEAIDSSNDNVLKAVLDFNATLEVEYRE